MVLMLTKNSFELFSCLIPYRYVIFKNKENKTKSKQFRREIRKLGSKEAHNRDLEQPQSLPQKTKVTTVTHYNRKVKESQL